MFCGKCGKQIDDNVKFCLYCGNPVKQRTGGMPAKAASPQASASKTAPADNVSKEEIAKEQAAPAPESIQKQQPAQAPKPKAEQSAQAQKSGLSAPESKLVPEKIVKPEKTKVKKKKSAWAFVFGFLSLLLAVAIVLMAFGIFSLSVDSNGVNIAVNPAQAVSSQASSVAAKGFESPEQAIEFFIEKIKSGDIDGALGACASGLMAVNYDYEKMAERLNAIMPIVNGANVPGSEYTLAAKYKETTYNTSILMQLSHIIYGLNSQGENSKVIEGQPLMPIDDVDFDELIGYFDPEVLKELKIVKIDEHSMNSDDRNRENQKKQAGILGADTQDFRSVLYEYDGDYFAGGFTLIEYDGEWFIVNMIDPLLGVSAYGTLQPVDSEEEFSDMLG